MPGLPVAGGDRATAGRVRSDEREPLLAAGQLLVATAYGVARAPRAGRATRAASSASSTGTPRLARSRIVSATTPIALRCSSTKSRSTTAPWPGTTTDVARGQAEHEVEASAATPSGSSRRRTPARARVGLLDQVAGQQRRRRRGRARPGRRRCGRGRVDQLDQPVAQVERDRRGERPVGRRRPRSRATSARVRVVRSAAVARPWRARSARGVSAAASWARSASAVLLARSTPLPKVWSKCSWVLTAHSTGRPRTPAQVGDHLARQRGRGVRVEHQQPGARPRPP